LDRSLANPIDVTREFANFAHVETDLNSFDGREGTTMNSFAISSIVFGVVFGGAMVGMLLRAVLPQHSLNDDTKDLVKMGMGLVATMSALVLGLLISSAKNSYDALNGEWTRVAAKAILLDRTLALYGPEAKEVRNQLHSGVEGMIERMEIKKSAKPSQVSASNREIDEVYKKIQGLSPNDDKQRSIQGRALDILGSIQEIKWVIFEHQATSISMPMLIILVSWLVTLFISFGLFAPPNRTAFTALLVSALSVSSAVLLILELYAPYGGMIRVLSTPFRVALTQMGN
jgi:hypothetical protein